MSVPSLPNDWPNTPRYWPLPRPLPQREGRDYRDTPIVCKTLRPFVTDILSWSAKRFSLLLLRKSHGLRNVSALCYWESLIVCKNVSDFCCWENIMFCATFQPFVIERVSWSAQRFGLLLLRKPHSLQNVSAFCYWYTLIVCETFQPYVIERAS